MLDPTSVRCYIYRLQAIPSLSKPKDFPKMDMYQWLLQLPQYVSITIRPSIISQTWLVLQQHRQGSLNWFSHIFSVLINITSVYRASIPSCICLQKFECSFSVLKEGHSLSVVITWSIDAVGAWMRLCAILVSDAISPAHQSSVTVEAYKEDLS